MQSQTLDTYDNIASDWNSTRRTEKNNIWMPELLKFKQLLPFGKILDIGCGTGKDSFWFLENGYEYLGMDGSKAMIKLARQNNPKAKFEAKTFEELATMTEKFHGFWACASLLHLPKTEIKSTLENIKAILLPKAVGFISLKEGIGEENSEWNKSGHHRFFAHYQIEEFSKCLTNLEFKIVEVGRRQIRKGIPTIWLTYFVTI